MSLVDLVRRVLRGRSSESSGSQELPPALDREKFIYVKIPENIGPLDRAAKYENSLDARLQAESLGEVSGGGSQLGDEKPDGTRDIEFCGIDIDVHSLLPALELLRRELPTLGVPDGTELHYTRQQTRLQDVFANGAWHVGLSRSFTHPGFGW